MAINLKFDLIGNPEPPSIVLANRNGNKLGQLNVNVESIDVSDKFNAASEFSFTLNKYIDDELTPLWEKVVDFKLVYCPEWDLWFEIKVELDETTETVKTVFCTQLGQAELSQIMLYNIEINTDVDIEREDFKTSILYDEDNQESSILHRLLEKAPHYSIVYVDESIQRIQRQFSFDGTSIYDAFNEIAEEIGCLFVYNSNTQAGGKPNRTISVYDLQQSCKSCGHRGEFTDKCPKCGSTEIKYGYGEDTTIFVTSDELATEGIQLVTDVDSVKNCFKLEGGDDLMTATIRNCNPNGSDYIWYFSDTLKEDMSKELVEGIESYDKKYQRYYNEHISVLNESLVSKYNTLVKKYEGYYNTKSTCLDCDTEGYFYEQCPNCKSKNILVGQKLQTIDTTITGYPDLMTAYYNTIDLTLYLKSGLMPTVEMSDTNAEEQLKLLTTSTLSPVAVNVEKLSSVSLATANSAVLSMAKVIVRPAYKVEIKSSTLSDSKVWSGQFTVTNYSDETDTATGDTITVVVNNNTEEFIKQKIEKALNKESTDDYSITGLFAKEYDDFCAELKKYALNPLVSFSGACDTCISILSEQGVSSYASLYKSYYDKQQAINNEIKIREDEIAIVEGVWDKSNENNPKCITWGLQQYIEKCQQDIQEALDFEKHLGKDLWLEFCAYRREDKYSNSNYVSDGLNNAELFKNAREFIEVAEEEIFKSAELQHSISATLNNLLSLTKFKPLLKSFKAGNWIRVQIDDKVYKLRLLEYGFGYGDSKGISVEFSDVIKIKNSITDTKNVLEQSKSMASSYDSVQRQAKKGNVARSTIDQWLIDGLSAANVQIQSNNNEEILLTKSGLLARSYDDITGTYAPEQLKITHNIMAYTDDNWKTVRQAIGKHEYNLYNKDENKFVNKIGYGMNADFVVAGVVSGSQIIGGDIYSDNYSITDATGSYLNLRDGTFSFGGGSLRYENGKLIISSKAADTNITEINEEWLKTTSVYAENLQVNSAKIQGKLTASQIDVGSLDADEIIGTTIHSKTITSSNFIGGYLLIGDEKKVNDYAEIANNGTLTCTNANISGTINAVKGSIGGFTIETTETNEDGDKSGGWLYSGESIGSDKSIFLSATDMSGTVNETTLDDWRITVGSNFGVTSDGTTYMSNCEITGGSLRMGNSEDGYSAWISVEDGKLYAQGAIIEGDSYFTGTITASDIVGKSTLKLGEQKDEEGNVTGYLTWISEDGILNAQGANIDGTITAVSGTIGGWDISTNKISKDNVILSTSDTLTYQSLITSTTSPIRISVGDNGVRIATYNLETLNTPNLITVGDFLVLTIMADATVTSAKLIDYWTSNNDYTEEMFGEAYIETSYNTIQVYIKNPDPDENIGFGFAIEYVVDVSPSFCLLADGSLYANAAKISGTVNATSGKIGGCSIVNGSLQIGNANISETLSADKIDGQNLNIIDGTFANCTIKDTCKLIGDNSTTSITNHGLKIRTNEMAYRSETFEYHMGAGGSFMYTGSSSAEIPYSLVFGTSTVGVGTDTSYMNTTGLYISPAGFVALHNNSTYGIDLTADGGSMSLGARMDMGLASEGNMSLETKGIGTLKGTWQLESGTAITSDKNLKHDITSLDDNYSNLFDALKPMKFKYNDGTSNRYHTGFIAQNVYEATVNAGLTTNDFAAYVEFKNEDDSVKCGLRYSEFISLNTWQIQKLKKRVEELEAKLEALTNI